MKQFLNNLFKNNCIFLKISKFDLSKNLSNCLVNLHNLGIVEKSKIHFEALNALKFWLQTFKNKTFYISNWSSLKLFVNFDGQKAHSNISSFHMFILVIYYINYTFKIFLYIKY